MQISGPIGGILFDMDGVVVQQRLDFPAIKREIFGDAHGLILERMAGLPASERARAEAILERHEAAAAAAAEPMDGILPFLRWMDARGLKRGLVTRNSRKSVDLVLARLSLRFDAVVTREDAPPSRRRSRCGWPAGGWASRPRRRCSSATSSSTCWRGDGLACPRSCCGARCRTIRSTRTSAWILWTSCARCSSARGSPFP